jgi:hypothetical protein
MTTLYWISTTFSALALALSGLSYFFHQATIDGIANLGFPHFFRIELGVLQLLGAVVLLAPVFSPQMKEWAYAGAALFYMTAIIAHIAHRDSYVISIINVVLISNLFVSNYALHAAYKELP